MDERDQATPARDPAVPSRRIPDGAPPGTERRVRDQAERLLDHAEEAVGVADQVVGLPLGDRAGRAGLGRGPLGGPGGEEPGPLLQLGRHLGQQHPGVALLAAAGRGRTGAGREQRGRRSQRGDVGRGVAGGDVGGGDRLLQGGGRAGEVGVGGRGQGVGAGLVGHGVLLSRRSRRAASCRGSSRRRGRRPRCRPVVAVGRAAAAGLDPPQLTLDEQVGRTGRPGRADRARSPLPVAAGRRSRSRPGRRRSATRDRSPPSGRAPPAPSTAGRATGTARVPRHGGPGPSTQPRRTSTGSSYRLTAAPLGTCSTPRPATSVDRAPRCTGRVRRRRGSRSPRRTR